MNRLLSCPFCGGTPAFLPRPEPGRGMIVLGCSTEGCVGNCLAFDFTSEARAITAWNTRPSQPLSADRSVLNTFADALDTADRLIERAYGMDVPFEWNEAFKAAQDARSALPEGEGVGEGLVVLTDAIARELSLGDEFGDDQAARDRNPHIGDIPEVGRRAEHTGDCTNQPWTCMRCLSDDYYARSHRIVALVNEALAGVKLPVTEDAGTGDSYGEAP